MTERRISALSQSPDAFGVEASRLVWHQDNTLSIELDEQCAPVPRSVRGRIHLTPDYINQRSFQLDANARHRWRPIAPSARVSVELSQPRLSWHGHAYFDSNWGLEPLENGFSYWDWSRAQVGEDTFILYDMTRRDQTPNALALRFDRQGQLSEFDPPPQVSLPRSPWWRMPRRTQADPGHRPQVVKTLEDTPFYVRSLISSRVHEQPVTAVHESLAMDRFTSGIVQWMLPYRMPRR